MITKPNQYSPARSPTPNHGVTQSRETTSGGDAWLIALVAGDDQHCDRKAERDHSEDDRDDEHDYIASNTWARPRDSNAARSEATSASVMGRYGPSLPSRIHS
jgi:hypothetical protein